MNEIPEYIQKWIESLRSGNYSQQQGALKGPSGYCCLGVFCSIMGKEPSQYELNKNLMPIDNRDASKFYDFCREMIDADVVERGIDMNDNGLSFSEIANMIEEEYTTGRAS